MPRYTRDTTDTDKQHYYFPTQPNIQDRPAVIPHDPFPGALIGQRGGVRVAKGTLQYGARPVSESRGPLRPILRWVFQNDERDRNTPPLRRQLRIRKTHCFFLNPQANDISRLGRISKYCVIDHFEENLSTLNVSICCATVGLL